MARSGGEIGLGGRLAIIVLGVVLCGGFQSSNAIGSLLGVVGVALVVSAMGFVELGMALWYRAARRR